MCFHVNFAKILRTPFFSQNTFWRLLLYFSCFPQVPFFSFCFFLFLFYWLFLLFLFLTLLFYFLSQQRQLIFCRFNFTLKFFFFKSVMVTENVDHSRKCPFVSYVDLLHKISLYDHTHTPLRVQVMVSKSAENCVFVLIY